MLGFGPPSCSGPVELGVECIKSFKSIPRRNWKVANLDAFREEVEVAVADMATDLQEATLKRRVSNLVEVIAVADSHYIPRIRPRDMQKVWMTREVREAIKHRNCLRRQVATRREEWVLSCQTTNRLIKEAKKRSGRSLLSLSTLLLALLVLGGNLERWITVILTHQQF